MREAKSFEELEHYALRNALYHTARRQFFEFMWRLFTFLTIVGGAASVVDAFPNGYRIAAGLAVTLLGTLQLVFDFQGRARDHGLLQRRYYELIGRIHEGGDLSEKQRHAIMGELSRISGDEPPTLRALDSIAYNQATDSLLGEEGKSYRIPISWFQSLTAHLLPHTGASFDARPDAQSPAGPTE